MCETRIQQDFKEKIKIKQGYDKKNILKIGVEHIKDNG
jgi:hypothetical protein